MWSSSFFIKEGGDGTHVPWHQDSRAYGARAPDVATAWVALTDSTRGNGALQVIPGSHRRGELDSLLTRRREVVLGVNESEATIIPLRAGEMSLHHSSLVHGSPPNRAADRRIGVAIRYMSEFTKTPQAPREMPTVTVQVPYEPPRVERVLTEKELEREVLYGGFPGASPVEW